MSNDQAKPQARYKIVAINTVFALDGTPMFDGFQLRGVVGSVDPFVSGKFDGDAKDIATHSETIAWAKAQIGKYLECDSLMERAFATHGATRVSA